MTDLTSGPILCKAFKPQGPDRHPIFAWRGGGRGTREEWHRQSVQDVRAGERALVARAQAGDIAAFEELYRGHVCARLRAVPAGLATASQADELAQDVFVRAWQKLGTFRGDSAFSTWLHPLAVNTALSERRAMRRRTARVFATDDLEAFDTGPDVDRAGRRGWTWARAGDAAAGARAACSCCTTWKGTEHEEIAEMTGVATGTSKAQLHRARRLLRKGAGTMSCEEVLDRLDDFVDGACCRKRTSRTSSCTSRPAHRARRSLRSCASCWPGRPSCRAPWPAARPVARRIASRLGPRARPRSYWLAGLARGRVPWRWRSRWRCGRRARRRRRPWARSRRSRPRACRRSSRPRSASTTTRPPSSWRRWTRGAALPPATVQALDENLRAIDQALVDVRAAARADPTNPRLNHLLASTASKEGRDAAARREAHDLMSRGLGRMRRC